MQHDFDIEEIDTPRVWVAMLRHMGILLKGFRYDLHSHWKEVFSACGAAAAHEAPHRNVSYPDWVLLCKKYEDLAYRV